MSSEIDRTDNRGVSNPRRRSTDDSPTGSPAGGVGHGPQKHPAAAMNGNLENPAIGIPEDVPGHAEDAVFAMVLRLVRSIRSGMQSIESGQGMSGSQLWALWQISAQPGLRVADLADALHIQPSTASNLLDKLEARGWVRRERRDVDNRVVRLLLTAAGTDVLKTMPGPLQGRLRSALRDLSPDLRQGLHDGLVALVQHMDG